MEPEPIWVEMMSVLASTIGGFTERWREEETLRRTQVELRDFVENATVPLHWVAGDGTILWANQAELDLLGYRREEYVGRHIAEFHADARVIEDILTRLSRNEELNDYSAQVRCRDGSTKNVLISSNVYWRDGEFVHTRCFTRDVTAYKRSEERRHAEYSLRRAIENAVGAGIAACDREGVQTYVNPAFSAMLGWSEEELLGGRPPYVYWPPEEVEIIRAAFERMLRDDAPPDGFELRFQRKNGERFDALVVVRPFESGGEMRRSWLASVTDVSAHKAALRALERGRERLAWILQSAQVGTWEWDVASGRVDWSDNLEAIHGLPPGSFQGTFESFVQFLDPRDRASLQQAIDGAMRGRGDFDVELRVPSSGRWIEGKGRVIFDEAGRPERMVGIGMEITERKRSEERLESMAGELEQRVRERTALAERRAHQLRRFASELVHAEQRERRRLAQTLHDHLQQLLVAGKLHVHVLREQPDAAHLRRPMERLGQLLDECLDASRSLTMELAPPVLYEAGLAASLRWLAQRTKSQHRLSVTVDADEAAEPSTEDVRILLFQAVRELLFNVVKYAGVREARVEMKLDEDDNVRITVADEGVGFASELLDAPESDQDRFGLFSIRERLEVAGGRLQIDTAPGRGARMTVVAPRTSEAGEGRRESADARKAGRAAAPHADLGRIRVVLVDDHDTVREGLVSLLGQQDDIEVVAEASDGEEGLELARVLRPDVMVVDVSLPGMTGIELTRRITAELDGTRVIGLSMHEDLSESMLEVGAVSYLSKHGPSEALVAALRACAGSGRQPGDVHPVGSARRAGGRAR